jgi:hypothetical protein
MSRRGAGAAEAAAAAANEAARSVDASEAGRVLRAQRDKEPEQQKTVEVERPEPKKNPQAQIEDEIVEAHRARQKEEEDEALKTEPKAEVVETPEPVADAPESSPTEPPPSVPVASAPMVKVKVDGEEFEVAQAEVDEAGGVQAYRMVKAMENRMLQWFQQQMAPKEPQKTPQQAIMEKIDSLRYGTPEESAKAMQEILELSNPRIDQASLEQRTMARMKQSLAVESFKSEFADVVANPILMTAAKAMEQDRLQQGIPQDWNQFYKQLGNELRAVIGPKPSQASPVIEQTQQTSTPSQSDKEARKASNIVNLPQAAARAAAPAETKQKSREDILNEERKARGIPTG